eukprot:10687119-Lingulodinium_polyedra.AAC.1
MSPSQPPSSSHREAGPSIGSSRGGQVGVEALRARCRKLLCGARRPGQGWNAASSVPHCHIGPAPVDPAQRQRSRSQ